jgi:hypothetical protein
MKSTQVTNEKPQPCQIITSHAQNFFYNYNLLCQSPLIKKHEPTYRYFKIKNQDVGDNDTGSV